MDEQTVGIYERGAADYAQRRRAYHADRAEAFAASLPPNALRLDLGSGPGHYLPFLGRPVVAADAAPTMVAQARNRRDEADRPLGVVCDFEALPFRRRVFAGVWACKCLQHVPAERLPMVLAGLQRTISLGGVLDITLFGGEGTDISGEDFVDEDFPGRLFTWWRPETLARLLVGAGFEIESLETTVTPTREVLTATARRMRSLPDTVGPAMRLLICGLNPSLYAADAGIGFARPGNRFWPAARAAGLVSRDRDPDAALNQDGIGMTDLVKRATVAASELTADEYRAGLARVDHLVRWLRPGAVCFVGLAGWRAAIDPQAQAGVQPEGLGGVPVYVMPSTSGLNARSSLDELSEHLRAAAWLAGRG
jgi:TDG/mug DNA glycosylase family protein